MDRFTRAYIEAALWSSTDNSDESGGEPFDANYSEADIAPDTLARIVEDCEAFQRDNEVLLSQVPWTTEEQNGHDFWLTRNGHGAGFWDRGYGDLGDKLTDAAHAWSTFDLYIGDDGKVHGA